MKKNSSNFNLLRSRIVPGKSSVRTSQVLDSRSAGRPRSLSRLRRRHAAGGPRGHLPEAELAERPQVGGHLPRAFVCLLDLSMRPGWRKLRKKKISTGPMGFCPSLSAAPKTSRERARPFAGVRSGSRAPARRASLCCSAPGAPPSSQPPGSAASAPAGSRAAWVGSRDVWPGRSRSAGRRASWRGAVQVSGSRSQRAQGPVSAGWVEAAKGEEQNSLSGARTGCLSSQTGSPPVRRVGISCPLPAISPRSSFPCSELLLLLGQEELLCLALAVHGPAALAAVGHLAHWQVAPAAQRDLLMGSRKPSGRPELG